MNPDQESKYFEELEKLFNAKAEALTEEYEQVIDQTIRLTIRQIFQDGQALVRIKHMNERLPKLFDK